MKKILIVGLLIIFLVGCTNQDKPEFSFNKEFTVTEGKSYVLEDDSPIISITSVLFEDSRCPVGTNVRCVWEGEQGVRLNVKSIVSSNLDPDEIYLGETTNPTESLYGFEFELVSINSDKKQAVIVVKKNPIPNNEKTWFSIEPIQCRGNAWDEWIHGKMDIYFPCPEGHFCESISEEDIIYKWLEVEYGINLHESVSKQIYEVVCEACDCPRGDSIAVLVDSSNSEKMIELGWKKMEAIGCQEDAKVCSNGSIVVRQAPFCEFPACE